MSDYKHTLNLPSTPFPMKANLPNREPKMLELWSKMNLYQRCCDGADKSRSFILHDGPPYASGRPHMGTAMNKTVKDIIVKSRRLSGHYAPFVPGWDCHGLPIELNVEKKHGKPGHKISAADFRVACRAFASKQVAIQAEDFQRLGVLADWENPYKTMDFQYEADSIRALSSIISRGYLKRGFKPVHWCCACGSALAEAEVEYQDKESPAIDVAFVVSDLADLNKRIDGQLTGEVSFPIWTTTPWTLPANEAVCVHAEFPYVLLSAIDKNGKTLQLLCAQALQDALVARYELTDVSVVATLSGEVFDGLLLQHPLYEKTVPVIMGEHVTTDAGTGLVHTAPSHGEDDYRVGLKSGLPTRLLVNAKGVFTDEVGQFSGQFVFKANAAIIETLEANGRLLAHQPLQHSYPHCWRHKTPLIFRATPQWFIEMDSTQLRETACEQIEKTHWIPSWGKERIEGMVRNRPDWCVSRQRFWGTPIAICVDKKTQLPHPNSAELIEKVAKKVEESGIQAWFDYDLKELLGDEADNYEKITDVMDVWFDSGVTHHTVLDHREALSAPADLYFEGSDQHRGWFQSSLLTSVAMKGVAPFKTVLTHGYVVDGQGRKMSKSLGNGMFPADVVKKLGADVLRLWAASSDHTNDLNVSDEILNRTADAYRRIRNTARFLLGNIADFDVTTDTVPDESLIAIDRYMIEKTLALHQEILDAYETYQLQQIYQLLHNFCSVTLGSFYLDILKDRLYTSAKTGHARRSAQTALSVVLEYLVCWLAPILSFTAEEIWQAMSDERAESIFLTQWPERAQCSVVSADIDWDKMVDAREAVNKALELSRAEGNIGSGLDASVTVYAQPAMYDVLQSLGKELRFLLIVSDASVHPIEDAPEAAIESDAGLAVLITASSAEKCERCWQRRESVGQSAAHPTLCGRCEVNVESTEGEQRQWV